MSNTEEGVNTTTTIMKDNTEKTSPSAVVNIENTNTNTTNPLTDLFRKRQGKALTWKNVNVTVNTSSKNDDDKKHILKNVWGSAKNEVTAILGPSGSGKTTLLNVLSGRCKYTKNMSYESDIQFDGKVVHPDIDLKIRKQIAFVEQHDQLHISATTRESIYFSARLRLPNTITDDEITILTDNVINALGLESCADTIIGGESLKGISGGERKRCSIGVEIITHPSLIFLDEPTSGLDSFSALRLIQILQKLANTGASILLTLHQPSSDVLEQLDRLILLRSGRIMYQGSTDAVTDYFSTHTHPLPPKYNPCDWILMIAQTVSEDELDQLGYFPNTAEEMIEYETNRNNKKETDEEDAAASTPVEEPNLNDKEILNNNNNSNQNHHHVSLIIQIKYLLKRDLIGMTRNKMILGARLMLTSFISITMGLIFWQIGDSDWSDPVNAQSHFGAVLMTLMAALFGSALPTLLVFPEERPVFIREYSTNHYSLLAYFLSRTVWEAFLTGIQILFLTTVVYFMVDYQQRFGWLFIATYALAMSSTAIAMLIGSGVKDPKLAIEFLPMCFVPQILFAGFFIATDLIPIWLRWLSYVFPLTYGVKIVLENEFDRDCGSVQANIVCENILKRGDIDPDDVWWYWLVLLCIFASLRIGALFLLQKKALK